MAYSRIGGCDYSTEAGWSKGKKPFCPDAGRKNAGGGHTHEAGCRTGEADAGEWGVHEGTGVRPRSGAGSKWVSGKAWVGLWGGGCQVTVQMLTGADKE